jgi:hypothetical protein
MDDSMACFLTSPLTPSLTPSLTSLLSLSLSLAFILEQESRIGPDSPSSSLALFISRHKAEVNAQANIMIMIIQWQNKGILHYCTTALRLLLHNNKRGVEWMVEQMLCGVSMNLAPTSF